MRVSPDLVKSPSLTDAEVVRRVCAGERELFEVLMRRYNGRVFRTIRAIIRDHEESEDAMQETWIRAYQHLGEFAGTAAFSTWLVRIAVNEALGGLRRRARRAPLERADGDEERTMEDIRQEGPEERAAASEAVRLLERAVDRLDDPYRAVFVLRDMEQLSTRETAEALGLREDAVKVRLHRAHAMLRRDLGEQVQRAAPEAFPYLAPRCDRMVERVMTAIARLGPPASGVTPPA